MDAHEVHAVDPLPALEPDRAALDALDGPAELDLLCPLWCIGGVKLDTE